MCILFSCKPNLPTDENIKTLYGNIVATTLSFPDSAAILVETCLAQTASTNEFYYAKCLIAKGKIARNKGAYAKSITILEEASDIAERIGNDTLKSSILSEKFWTYFRQDDELMCRRTLAENEAYNLQIQHNAGLLNVYNLRLYFSLNDFEEGDLEQKDSILIFYQKGIALSNAEADSNYISAFERNIARYYRIIGQIDTAIYIMKATIPYHKGNDADLYNLYSIYQTISYFYQEKEDVANTIKYLNLAIEIAEQMDDNWSKQLSYYNLGMLYEKYCIYDKSIEIYKYIVEVLFSQEEEDYKLIRYYAKIGYNYHQLGIKDSAAYYLEKSLNIKGKEGANDPAATALAYTYHADFLQATGNFELATQQLANAGDLRGLLGENELDEIDVHTNLISAAIYEKNQNYGQTVQATQAALEVLNTTKNIHISNPIDLRLQALELLSSHYENQSNFQQANKYLRQMEATLAQLKEVTQSVLLIDLAQEVEKNREQFESRRLKLEKELQSERIATQQRLNQILLLGILLSLVLLSTVWYLLVKSRKNNKIIAQQSQKLEELNKLKDKVFAVIGHDLRGPVGGIKTVLDMVVKGQLPKADFLSMTGDMQKNATAVYEILNNLLIWARMQISGKEDTPTTVTKLSEQVESVHHFLAEALAEKQIRFQASANDLAVKADPNDVNIILRNLVSNAIKFTASGGRIEVKAEQLEKALKVTVSDTGIGIPKEKLPTIFELGDSTFGTAGEKGTGIGLNLCKEIVEKYRGTIGVTSNIGEGSQFYFTLPIVS
ncbi:MAG: HAMP domain-containing sensor histidine kinase [Bacteroidota bacterium]